MDAPSKISTPKERRSSLDSAGEIDDSPQSPRIFEEIRSKSSSDAATKYLAGIMPYQNSSTISARRRSSSTTYEAYSPPAATTSPVPMVKAPPLILEKSSSPETTRIPTGCLSDVELQHLGYFFPRGRERESGPMALLKIKEGNEDVAVQICKKIKNALQENVEHDFSQEVQTNLLTNIMTIAGKKLAANRKPSSALDPQEAFNLKALIAKQTPGTTKHFGR